MRRGAIGAAALAAGLLLAPSALAEKSRYAGTASDGTRVTLQTIGDGKPRLVRFGDYEAPCNRGKPPLKDPIGGFIPPFDVATRDKLDDHGRAGGKTDKRRVTVKWDLFATHTDDDRWVGDYETVWAYTRNGNLIKRCTASFDFELTLKP